MAKGVPAPICEGQVADGRRCQRRTRSPDGLCGLCKGKQDKREKQAARRQQQPSAGVSTAETGEPASMFLLVGHNYSSVLEQIYRASDHDIDETLRTLEPNMGNSSAYTDAEFVGVNGFYLAARGYQKKYQSREWATASQWRKLGGRVPGDTDGARIFVENDVEGQAYLTFVTVYNKDQVEFRKGRDSERDSAETADRPPAHTNGHYQALAAAVESNLGVVLKSGRDAPDRPGVFYPRLYNTITLEDPELARSEQERSLQLLHELMHWTRPYRTMLTEDETEEELAAVFGTAMAANRLRMTLTGDPGRGHSKYLNAVHEKLQPEPLLRATSFGSQSVKILTSKGVLPSPFKRGAGTEAPGLL